jgi:hypothetical protein
MLPALPVLLLIGAFVGAAGLLVSFVVAAATAVRTATAAARERLRHDLAALTTEQLRARLLTDDYFAADLRRVPAIAQFLAQLRAGLEAQLATRYSRQRLYRLLARAERTAGRRGRPEAVDTIDEIHEGLLELARRGGR